ncbi:hypothetical protein C7A09_14290 [Pseudomonas fluorescens]|nr:hypothetical protein C7A09_14290 [Pseudomonas fluorescens]
MSQLQSSPRKPVISKVASQAPKKKVLRSLLFAEVPFLEILSFVTIFIFYGASFVMTHGARTTLGTVKIFFLDHKFRCLH